MNLTVAFFCLTITSSLGQTEFPILDSNLDEVQEVIITDYDDGANCSFLKNAAKDPVISFLLKKNVKVCFVPHFKYCLNGYVGEDDYGCEEIEERVNKDPNVIAAQLVVDSIYKELSQERKLKKDDLYSWLGGHNLRDIDLTVDPSTNLLDSFALSEDEWSHAIKQLINVENVSYSFELNKRGNLSDFVVNIPGNLPVEISVLQQGDFFGRQLNKKTRAALKELLFADQMLITFKNNARKTFISDYIINGMKSTVKDVGIEERLEVTPEIELIDCKKRPDRVNRKDIDSQLKRWMQDKIHVRTTPDDSIKLGAINEHKNDGYENVKQYFRIGPGCFVNDVLDNERLRDVSGGNLFKIDDILFIGKDELKKYQTDRTALKHLKAKDTSKKEIETALLESVFGKSGIGNLVWIGTTDSILSQSLSKCKWAYQPFYHIDLFFHPLGTVGNSKEFNILIADDLIYVDIDEVDDISINMVDDNRSKFNRAIEKIKSSVSSKLESLGYNTNWIPVPVAIDYVPNYKNQKGIDCTYGKTILSPINGISSRLENRIVYWMPIDVAFRTKDVLEYYAKVFNRLENLRLDNRGISIERVNGNYGARDALHCLVKVVRRRHPH